MASIKASLRKLLQGFARGTYLAPQCFQLAVINVLLDGSNSSFGVFSFFRSDCLPPYLPGRPSSVPKDTASRKL